MTREGEHRRSRHPYTVIGYARALEVLHRAAFYTGLDGPRVISFELLKQHGGSGSSSSSIPGSCRALIDLTSLVTQMVSEGKKIPSKLTKTVADNIA